jgi:hypothetical protein
MEGGVETRLKGSFPCLEEGFCQPTVIFDEQKCGTLISNVIKTREQVIL